MSELSVPVPSPGDRDRGPWRLLVCGSRTWTAQLPVMMLLGAVPRGTTVIHGAAKGADSIAGFYAQQNGLPVEEFPAQWAEHGKKAGYIRNAEMLHIGKPTLLYAFVDKPLAESKGTAMMVALATAAGVPSYVVEAVHAAPAPVVEVAVDE